MHLLMLDRGDYKYMYKVFTNATVNMSHSNKNKTNSYKTCKFIFASVVNQ